jgi:hypothetical protein
MGFVFWYIKIFIVEKEKETHENKHVHYMLKILCHAFKVCVEWCKQTFS